MEDKRKRQRSANLTKHEENVLFNKIFKYKNIVENKKTDAVSSDEKKVAWQNISNEFNAISPNSCERTIDSLKKMYENRKKELRKDKAEERKETLLTGGGPPLIKKDDLSSELLLTIMNEKSVFGTDSLFDSDSFSPLLNCSQSNNDRDKYLAYELSDENRVTEEDGKEKRSQDGYELEEDNTDMNKQESEVTRWKTYKPLDLNKSKSNVLQSKSLEKKPSCPPAAKGFSWELETTSKRSATTEDTVTFEPGKPVSLDVPDKLFGSSFTLVTNLSTSVGDFMINSALRAHRLLESMRPFLRKIFGAKGVVIEATTDKPIFSDPSSS